MATTVPDKSIVNGLLEELAKEEKRVSEAFNAMIAAQTAHTIARKRYAAVRDAAAKYMGRFPYDEDVKWPTAALAIEMAPPYKRGRFRFSEMPLGEAVATALRQAGKPMTADELLHVFSYGGIGTTARAIHAAAINTPGVVKDGDSYRYEAPVEPDLPF